MGAFLPRATAVIGIGPLRDKYLMAEVPLTRRVLMDTEIDMREELRTQIRAKARLVKGALACLAAAVVLAVLAGILDRGGGAWPKTEPGETIGTPSWRRRTRPTPTSWTTPRTTSA
jgi:hypothetical protein